jgi:heme/copper-type cytochrome/quinol oxidase subunit 3
VSQATAQENYLPEDHAPDPVISHGDPTPPGKVAIWLFLASEIMFFVALLGSYIVLRAGSPRLFSAHAAALSKPLAAVNTVVLIFSSLTMALSVEASQQGKRNRLILFLTLTVLCALTFMGIKSVEYTDKYFHHTIVAKDGNKFYVYDGHQEERNAKEVTLLGYRMPLGAEQTGVNVHLISQQDVATHPDGTDGETL